MLIPIEQEIKDIETFINKLDAKNKKMVKLQNEYKDKLCNDRYIIDYCYRKNIDLERLSKCDLYKIGNCKAFATKDSIHDIVLVVEIVGDCMILSHTKEIWKVAI